MAKQQTVKGPFIGMLVLGFLYLVYCIFAIIFSESEVYLVLIFPLLFFSEAFVYWRVRKKILNKRVAWAHVLLLVFGFLNITLIAFLAIYFENDYYLSSDDSTLIDLASFIINYAFWGTFVLAHIFFVITIVKSFSKKQELKTDEPSPGLLDEFVN
jgi:hypothetical protein